MNTQADSVLARTFSVQARNGLVDIAGASIGVHNRHAESWSCTCPALPDGAIEREHRSIAPQE
jgi:hypothetical protein